MDRLRGRTGSTGKASKSQKSRKSVKSMRRGCLKMKPDTGLMHSLSSTCCCCCCYRLLHYPTFVCQSGRRYAGPGFQSLLAFTFPACALLSSRSPFRSPALASRSASSFANSDRRRRWQATWYKD